MSDMISFDKNIEKVIKKLSYPFHLIQQDFSVQCSCFDFTTKQPDYKCKKCLGTGYKIRIKNIQGVRQTSEKTTIRGEGLGVGETATKTIYHILGDIFIRKDNIIVDNKEVDIIQRTAKKRSDHSFQVFFKCEAMSKKTNTQIFLQNFYEIVGEK